MHPYRALYCSEPEATAPADTGASSAFGVLGLTGAVQVGVSLSCDQPVMATLAGVAALLAAFAWFSRGTVEVNLPVCRRGPARAADSRRPPR